MNTVLFKGFDLSLDLQYAFGFYLFNTTEQGLANYANVSNKTTDILKAWKQPGDVSDFPRLFWNDVTWSQASTRFLEKGDFVRLRNLQIGYSFSPGLISRIKLSRVRFYVQGQNLYTFTGYKGVDPEANANGNTNIGLGVDNNRPYLPRTLTVGLQIGF
jgi:TonB-dependent starch-binding outer membrane protein SusC